MDLADEGLGKSERPHRMVKGMTCVLRSRVFRETDQGGMGRIGSCSDDERVGLGWRQGMASDDEVVPGGSHCRDCVRGAIDRDVEALLLEDGLARVEEHFVGSDEECGRGRCGWDEVLGHGGAFYCFQ